LCHWITDPGPDPAHTKTKTLFSQDTEGTLKIITLLQSHKTVEIKVPNSFLLLIEGSGPVTKITGPNQDHSLMQNSEFLIFLNGTVPYHTYSLNLRDPNPRTLP
jgi:hypothetical protein